MEIFDLSKRSATDILTHNSMAPILRRAAKLRAQKLPFTPSDIPPLNPEFSSANPEFPTLLDLNRPLLLSIFLVVRSQFLIAVGLHIVIMLICTYEPVLLKSFVAFLETGEDDPKPGFSIAWIMIVITIAKGLLYDAVGTLIYSASLKVSSILCAAIIGKTARLPADELERQGQGKIVHILERRNELARSIKTLNDIWVDPARFVISLVLLLREVGSTFAVALCLSAVSFYLNWIINKKYKEINQKKRNYARQVAKTLGESLRGIKAIKLNGWEHPAGKRTEDLFVKRKALDIYGRILLQLNSAQRELISNAIIIFAIVGIILSGEPLTVSKVYAVVALYDSVRFPLFSFGDRCLDFSSMRVQAQEVEQFLRLPERSVPAGSAKLKLGEIVFDSASICCFEKGQQASTSTVAKAERKASLRTVLHGINVQVAPGSLVGIAGPVGTGKSLLLRGVLHEVFIGGGTISASGRAVYLPHDSWIFNSTLRENIIAEHQFDKTKYDRAVELCQLRQDIDLMPGRDETEIGSRGINLSGGQRQRIALARALYGDGDIFLLDDSLCQLDPCVATQIFHDVIVKHLAGKTRLFVTSNVAWLPEVSRIILINSGTVAGDGTYTSLCKNPVFISLQDQHRRKSSSAAATINPESPSREVDTEHSDDSSGSPEKQKLIQEKPAPTEIDWRVIRRILFSYGNVWLIPLFFVSLLLHTFFLTLHDKWLFVWAADGWHSSSTFYGCAYLTIIFLGSAFDIAAHSIRKNYEAGILTAIHTKMLQKVLNAPLAWHDVTLSGRIIAKLTSSFDGMFMVIFNASIFFEHTFDLAFSLYYLASVLPESLLVVIPAAVLFRYASQAQRPLLDLLRQRDDRARDKLTTIYQELIDGVFVLRSAGERALAWVSAKVFAEHDRGLASWSLLEGAFYWANDRRRLMSNTMYAYVVIFCLARRDWVGPAMAALALKKCWNITRTLNSIFDLIGSFDANLLSCTQLLAFMDDIPAEKVAPSAEKYQDWPRTNAVDISHLSLRHREELPLVVKGASISIKPGEKLGIVGRTGSGKSTFLLGLIRVIEPFHRPDTKTMQEGISVGGTSIEEIALSRLRARVVMIPQEPWLFAGTVRENVDLAGGTSDEDIVGVIGRIGLRTVLERKLDSKSSPKRSVLDILISENGTNLSQGERQLLCLARGLVRRPAVLVMDEATANLDEASDQSLQDYLKREMKGTTIIMVAHRQSSLEMCDRIVTLHNGESFSETSLSLSLQIANNNSSS